VHDGLDDPSTESNKQPVEDFPVAIQQASAPVAAVGVRGEWERGDRPATRSRKRVL